MAVAYGFNPAEININPYDPNSPGYDGKINHLLEEEEILK